MADGGKRRGVMGVTRAISHFGATTSLKGISRSVKSVARINRMLWVAAFVLGMLIGVYQLTQMVLLYLSHAVVSDTKTLGAGSTTFPDVTLCNLNPVSNSADNILTYEGYIQSVAERFRDADSPFSAPSTDSGAGFPDHYYNWDEYLTDYQPYYYYASGSDGGGGSSTGSSSGGNEGARELSLTAGEISELKSHLQSVSGYFQNIPMVQHADASKTDFILRCTFHDWDWAVMELNCTPTSLGGAVSVKFIPDYFACYTISVPEHAKAKVRGVSVVLHLDNFQNTVLPPDSHFEPDLLHSKAAGARVKVHPRHTYPNIKEGVTVSPGHETTLRMSQHERHLLPAPFSTCSAADTLPDLAAPESAEFPYRRPYSYHYHEGTCRELCLQERVMEKCRCINPYLAHVRDKASADPGNFCAFLNATLIANAEDEAMAEYLSSMGALYTVKRHRRKRAAPGVPGAVNNVTDNVTDNPTYNINYNVTYNVTDNLNYNVNGNITDNLNYNVNGNITDNLNYNVNGNITDNLNYNVNGNITDNVNDKVTDDVTSNVTEDDDAINLPEVPGDIPGSGGASGGGSEGGSGQEMLGEVNIPPFEINITEAEIKRVLVKMKCAIRTMEVNREGDTCAVTCPASCEETTYDIKVSASPWPLKAYHLAFYERFISNSSFVGKYNDSGYEWMMEESSNPQYTATIKRRIDEEAATIQDNFLQVNILMEEEKLILMSDVEKITWESLFGSAGGLMNLWIGITFFTLIELIEMVISMCNSPPPEGPDQQRKQDADMIAKKQTDTRLGQSQLSNQRKIHPHQPITTF